MIRALITLIALSLLTACGEPATSTNAAPEAKPVTKPEAAKAPEAKPATTAAAAKAPAPAASASPAAPSACGDGGLDKKKGKDCANPDCIYGDEKKGDGPAADCPHELDDKATAVAPSKEANHFGAAFALVANQPLSKGLSTPADTAVQLTGTIDKVCKKKGCWMVLKDGEAQARVLMKNYGFTVPLDCDGKVAAVEGTLKTKTFTEGQVKHLAEDGGEDPSKVSGTRTEYVITASGIRIQG